MAFPCVFEVLYLAKKSNLITISFRLRHLTGRGKGLQSAKENLRTDRWSPAQTRSRVPGVGHGHTKPADATSKATGRWMRSLQS